MNEGKGARRMRENEDEGVEGKRRRRKKCRVGGTVRRWPGRAPLRLIPPGERSYEPKLPYSIIFFLLEPRGTDTPHTPPQTRIGWPQPQLHSVKIFTLSGEDG